MWLKMRGWSCISAHLQCTDKGCTTEVNGETSIKNQRATFAGQFIALQAIDVLKKHDFVHNLFSDMRLSLINMKV